MGAVTQSSRSSAINSKDSWPAISAAIGTNARDRYGGNRVQS